MRQFPVGLCPPPSHRPRLDNTPTDDHDPPALLTEPTTFAAPRSARPRWVDDPAARLHRLPSGRLWIRPESAIDATRLDRLCAYAARPNPRRGFLFVSTILGRYLPVAPARFDGAVAALHAELPALPGPVVFVGVAEAGVALAHALHARHVEAGRDDAVLVTTTRHRYAAPLLYAFDEPHSHAPRHRIYAPADPRARARLRAAASVVVVDDEITTGRTFAGLVAAHRRRFPAARRYVHAVLTSWLDRPLADAVAGSTADPLAAQVELAALARARYHFEPDPGYAPALPDAIGADRCHPATDALGRCAPLCIADPADAPLPAIDPAARLLVLGSGELQAPALLVARRYTARRADVPAAAPVVYQATTRAPLRPGGLIRSAIAFPDDHGEGIAHYLYNVGPDDYDAVVVCHAEHPPAPALLDALAAVAPTVRCLDVRPLLGDP